jgi:hypothetical protein
MLKGDGRQGRIQRETRQNTKDERGWEKRWKRLKKGWNRLEKGWKRLEKGWKSLENMIKEYGKKDGRS